MKYADHKLYTPRMAIRAVTQRQSLSAIFRVGNRYLVTQANPKLAANQRKLERLFCDPATTWIGTYRPDCPRAYIFADMGIRSVPDGRRDYSPAEIARAVSLREQGLSYSVIKRELNVPMSTLRGWLQRTRIVA